MNPILAHGSGWDELLLFLAAPVAWFTFVAVRRALDRRRSRSEPR